jgi:hypothetical protein
MTNGETVVLLKLLLSLRHVSLRRHMHGSAVAGSPPVLSRHSIAHIRTGDFIGPIGERVDVS